MPYIFGFRSFFWRPKLTPRTGCVLPVAQRRDWRVQATALQGVKDKLVEISVTDLHNTVRMSVVSFRNVNGHKQNNIVKLSMCQE